jgi:hypothetical protein
MTTYFLEPRGQILSAAKQAAMDAVAGYERLNAYTIGVAVQAAAAVLRTDVEPPANRVQVEVEVRGAGEVSMVESLEPSSSVEVVRRLRALESVADAARSAHWGSAHVDAEPCPLCAALRQLEQAG